MEGSTMKRFACGDVVPGCDATFVCDTEDDVLFQVAQHAAAVHGMAEVPDSVVAQVRERIYAVA
jgi:predicted small metal-binding protein